MSFVSGMGVFFLLAFEFINVVINLLVLYFNQCFSMFLVGGMALVKVGMVLSPATSSTESRGDGDSGWRG